MASIWDAEMYGRDHDASVEQSEVVYLWSIILPQVVWFTMRSEVVREVVLNKTEEMYKITFCNETQKPENDMGSVQFHFSFTGDI